MCVTFPGYNDVILPGGSCKKHVSTVHISVGLATGLSSVDSVV